MSPLWIHFLRTIINQENPSPNLQKRLKIDLRPIGRLYKVLIKPLLPTKVKSIEGISVPIFFSKRIEAGMTLEASIVLPLFLFFFLNLSSAIEIIRLHGNLEMALWDTGNKMCIYGYALSEESHLQKNVKEGDDWWKELADLAFSYSYVKQELIHYAGEAYLENSPLTYGSAGLQFLGSDIFSRKDELEIVLTYQISPKCSIPGFRSFLMENHYYGHLWTGYEIPGTAERVNEDTARYYVTENGTVYHLSRDCTHLKLSYKKVSLKQALTDRNAQGGKYSPCQKCRKQASGSDVWIAEEGDRYHYSENCPGLKRTVYVITEKEKKNYRPCSRCAKEES